MGRNRTGPVGGVGEVGSMILVRVRVREGEESVILVRVRVREGEESVILVMIWLWFIIPVNSAFYRHAKVNTYGLI